MFTLSQRKSIVRNHPPFAAAKHAKKPGFERMEFVRALHRVSEDEKGGEMKKCDNPLVS